MPAAQFLPAGWEKMSRHQRSRSIAFMRGVSTERLPVTGPGGAGVYFVLSGMNKAISGKAISRPIITISVTTNGAAPAITS